MQDKVIIAVILIVLGLGSGVYFTRLHYLAKVVALETDIKNIKEASKRLKEENELFLADLASRPIVPPSPEVVERIKKIYVDKPIYVYKDSECKLTDNFTEAYNEYLRLAK